MSNIYEFINENYDMAELYHQYTGREVPTSGKVMCPFHANTNTTAAKIYREGNFLKCFGMCGRTFRPYDLMKKYDPDAVKEILRTQIIPSYSVEQVKKITISRSELLSKCSSLEQIYDTIVSKVG